MTLGGTSMSVAVCVLLHGASVWELSRSEENMLDPAQLVHPPQLKLPELVEAQRY